MASREIEARKKLRLLKKYAEIIIPYKHQQELEQRRTQFNTSKGKILPLSGKHGCFCFVCLAPSDVRHHIIQLQNGGINSKKNLVTLCNGCHKEVHPWLAQSRYSPYATPYKL